MPWEEWDGIELNVKSEYQEGVAGTLFNFQNSGMKYLGFEESNLPFIFWKVDNKINNTVQLRPIRALLMEYSMAI